MIQLTQNEITQQFPKSYLRELSLFGALSHESMEFLLAKGKMLSFKTDEKVFKLHGISGQFYIILQGELGYFRYFDGEKIYIKSYYPGEQVSYTSMIG